MHQNNPIKPNVSMSAAKSGLVTSEKVVEISSNTWKDIMFQKKQADTVETQANAGFVLDFGDFDDKPTVASQPAQPVK